MILRKKPEFYYLSIFMNFPRQENQIPAPGYLIKFRKLESKTKRKQAPNFVNMIFHNIILWFYVRDIAAGVQRRKNVYTRFNQDLPNKKKTFTIKEEKDFVEKLKYFFKALKKAALFSLLLIPLLLILKRKFVFKSYLNKFHWSVINSQ